MKQFKLSPLKQGKTKKRDLKRPLILIILAITIISSTWIFRLHQKIDYLETQLNTQNKGEHNYV